MKSELIAEMPGRIVFIEKNIEEAVVLDETVLVIESMKMEIPIVASRAGRLVSIAVSVGDQVVEGQLLATIEH
jgi:acetyl-CoA carboxylase biotin carboxyl carrier protein